MKKRIVLVTFIPPETTFVSNDLGQTFINYEKDIAKLTVSSTPNTITYQLKYRVKRNRRLRIIQ